jgi:RHS repeat-associated protein
VTHIGLSDAVCCSTQLTQVVSGTLTTQYAYSGDGVRRSQIANGVETRYAVDVASGLPRVLQETRSGATTRYLYGLDQLATQDSGTWAYHHPDGLGSVRQMSDASGQVVMARSYTPFGAVKSQAGTANGSFGYAGEQQDAASDLTFLRARYYDPNTGRFLTRDPYPAYATVPSTLHRYAYAASNPINLTDPSGLMPDLPTATFGNGGLLYPPQPGAPQYDLTGRADGLRGLVDAANQLSRALSQGARSPECGPTGVLGDWWQSLERGTLGPDLLRWGLNEARTNPLWQQRFTEAELRQFALDLAKRGEFGITGLLRQIVDEKGLQHWIAGQVDYAVQALRSMRDDPRQLAVLAFNLGTGLIATGLGPAGLLALPAILAANVAFQTWVESGGGLNFNWAAFRSSFQINVAATGAGMAGGMIGQMIGGSVGRLVGSALGGGLGQIVTNGIQGRPWDEGLLFNTGLSVGMEGVMMGAEGYVESRALREAGISPRHADAIASVLQEGDVVAARLRNPDAMKYDELHFETKPEGHKIFDPETGEWFSPKSKNFDGLVPKKYFELPDGRSVLKLTPGEIRQMPIEFLRDKFYVSDIDLGVITSKGRIVSVEELRSTWVERLNKAIRGRDQIDSLSFPSGPEQVMVEPTDYIQHTTWSTWPGNEGKVPPGGVFVFDKSSGTLRVYTVPEDQYNTWIAGKVPPQHLRPYGWPWKREEK